MGLLKGLPRPPSASGNQPATSVRHIWLPSAALYGARVEERAVGHHGLHGYVAGVAEAGTGGAREGRPRHHVPACARIGPHLTAVGVVGAHVEVAAVLGHGGRHPVVAVAEARTRAKGAGGVLPHQLGHRSAAPAPYLAAVDLVTRAHVEGIAVRAWGLVIDDHGLGRHWLFGSPKPGPNTCIIVEDRAVVAPQLAAVIVGGADVEVFPHGRHGADAVVVRIAEAGGLDAGAAHAHQFLVTVSVVAPQLAAGDLVEGAHVEGTVEDGHRGDDHRSGRCRSRGRGRWANPPPPASPS